MGTVLVWYLVVRSVTSDNAIAIPQADRAQCVANLKFIRESRFAVGSGTAYCIPGVR